MIRASTGDDLDGQEIDQGCGNLLYRILRFVVYSVDNLSGLGIKAEFAGVSSVVVITHPSAAV
jgi:hypothetical protein